MLSWTFGHSLYVIVKEFHDVISKLAAVKQKIQLQAQSSQPHLSQVQNQPVALEPHPHPSRRGTANDNALPPPDMRHVDDGGGNHTDSRSVVVVPVRDDESDRLEESISRRSNDTASRDSLGGGSDVILHMHFPNTGPEVGISDGTSRISRSSSRLDNVGGVDCEGDEGKGDTSPKSPALPVVSEE
jgi:hypothetical protein